VSPDRNGPASLGAARLGLGVLAFINLFNYLDRYIVPPLFESLKHSELHPSDAQLGYLMSGFVLVYTLTAPVFGFFGDRRKRPRLLALGVLVWSVATALGGFARSIGQLLAARATVGVGEAAYATIGPALLADYFPRARRGRAFAVFYAAVPVGAALGYVVGGLVDHHFGWRRAFFVAGIPGVLLALLALRLHDAPRGVHDGVASEPVPHESLDFWGRVVDIWDRLVAYLELFSNRPYRLTVLGYAGYTFALGGIAAWMPVFLERVRGLPGAAATVRFGAIVVATGLVGTFAGGWLGDRLLQRTREAYLWVSAVATLLAAPLILVALTVADPAVFWTAIVIAELLMFASTGPINSAIVNAVSPGMRAMAMAVSIFAIHILGDVPSPALVGWISDRHSLATAVLILPIAALIGGVVWAWGAWVGGARGSPQSLTRS